MPDNLASGSFDGRDPAQRLAKEASLLNLWGLSLRPRYISSVAAWWVPMAAKETNSGATCATNWSSFVRLARHTSRGQSLPPSRREASRNHLRSLVGSTRPGFSAQMVHGHRRVEVQVCVHAQDHLD